jgi:hypothetical protein
VFVDKAAGVAAGVVVQDIGDVALLPKFDGAGVVTRRQHIAHAGEQLAQLFGLGVGEFDKFEPVGAGRVGRADRGFGGGVGERTHGDVSCADDEKIHRPHISKNLRNSGHHLRFMRISA